MPRVHRKWPGFSASQTIIIDVDRYQFGLQPSPITLNGKPFKPKPETHITVCGTAICEELMQRIVRDPARESVLVQAFEKTDWSYSTTDDYRHLLRGATDNAGATEESIIVLLEMDGMNSFFERLKLQELIDEETPVPPPHVTLYTHNCDSGIGVPSIHALNELSHARIDKERLTADS